MRNRAYIYVVPTSKYVKFGVTQYPMLRLSQHSFDTKERLSYFKVWKCDPSKTLKVEGAVKAFFSGLPQKTRERLYVDKEDIAVAILNAAAALGAKLEEQNIELLQNTAQVKIDVRLNTAVFVEIERWRADPRHWRNGRPITRTDAITVMIRGFLALERHHDAVA